MELISREKLKETIEPMVGRFDDDGEFWWTRESILRAIDNAPTIEERKEGRWIPHTKTHDVCSVCGEGTQVRIFSMDELGIMSETIYKYDYCPNCGARMKGE